MIEIIPFGSSGGGSDNVDEILLFYEAGAVDDLVFFDEAANEYYFITMPS